MRFVYSDLPFVRAKPSADFELGRSGILGPDLCEAVTFTGFGSRTRYTKMWTMSVIAPDCHRAANCRPAPPPDVWPSGV